MSAEAFATGVAALLTEDPTFVAAVNALLAQTVVNLYDGNVPLANVPADRLPCWVIEQGDGRSQGISNSADEGVTIGHYEQQFASDLHVALIWHEQGREIASAQRQRLPTLVAQLFLRNPQPGGIAFARLTDWESDRGGNHPLHVWRATLGGEYSIPQS